MRLLLASPLLPALALALCALPGTGEAQPSPSPAKAEWITLGTSGGPSVQAARSQIANALVVNGAVYLFDLGNGAQRQLARAGLHEADIKGVFITHHHIDHNASLGPVLVMHWTLADGVLPVFGPAGTVHMARELASANDATVLASFPTRGPARPALIDTFKATDLPEKLQEPTLVFTDANIKVYAIGVDHFQTPPSIPMSHMPDSVAYRIEAGGRTFVFSGDTGPSPRLERLAKDADVLITEVVEPGAVNAFLAHSLPDAQAPMRAAIAHSMTTNHLTPAQIGRMAEADHVGEVVLTHFVPIPEQTQDPQAFVRDIKNVFHGPVKMANDLDRF